MYNNWKCDLQKRLKPVWQVLLTIGVYLTLHGTYCCRQCCNKGCHTWPVVSYTLQSRVSPCWGCSIYGIEKTNYFISTLMLCDESHTREGGNIYRETEWIESPVADCNIERYICVKLVGLLKFRWCWVGKMSRSACTCNSVGNEYMCWVNTKSPHIIVGCSYFSNLESTRGINEYS